MTLIERVARVLCAHALRGTSQTPDDVVVYSDQGMEGRSITFPRWEWHTEAARAAIAAMREPTEAMAAAGSEAADEQDKYFCYDASPMVWRDMIDAALAEKPDEHGPPRA